MMHLLPHKAMNAQKLPVDYTYDITICTLFVLTDACGFTAAAGNAAAAASAASSAASAAAAGMLAKSRTSTVYTAHLT